MSTKEKSKEEKELDSFLKTFYELKKASKKKDFGFSCSWFGNFPYGKLVYRDEQEPVL